MPRTKDKAPALPFDAPESPHSGRLRLRRGIVFLDTETTGTDPSSDRIVELAMVRLEPDGTRREWTRRFDPGVPIPPEATAVHGIADADVRGCPRFAVVAPEVRAFLAGADLAGFNLLGYDLPLLIAEMKRAGADLPLEGIAVVDAMTIFHRKEKRDLTAAVRHYLGREHAGAHGALADASASLDVLLAELERYPDLPGDAEGLHRFCTAPPPGALTAKSGLVWRGGEAVFTFGKHKGKPLREVTKSDRGYLQWVVRESSLDADLVSIVRDSLDGRFPERKD